MPRLSSVLCVTPLSRLNSPPCLPLNMPLSALSPHPPPRPQIVDVVDCTGSGDVDTSKIATLTAEGLIPGAGGTLLKPNPAWSNPTGEWRVGCKRAFELVPSNLRSRMKEERRRLKDGAHRAAVTAALRDLAAFDAANPSVRPHPKRRPHPPSTQ